VRLGQSIVELDCLLRGRSRPRKILLRSACGVDRNQKASVGRACIGQRVARVLLRGLPEIAQRFLKILARTPVPKIASFQVELMRFRVLGRLDRDCVPFGAGKLCL
jgi:hypothetical protein